MTRLRTDCFKYKNKTLSQLVKVLFHGSRGARSETIYAGEEGLDIRFAGQGAYGQGIYFADNAAYSHNYVS